MFDFGNANERQRQAISAANGPVLITAGPGTGKTYTLVQRAIYLIEECRICPENINTDIILYILIMYVQICDTACAFSYLQSENVQNESGLTDTGFGLESVSVKLLVYTPSPIYRKSFRFRMRMNPE